MDSSGRTKRTPPQLARLWGVSPGKILDLIKSGELRAIDLSTKRGKRPRYAIDVRDIETFERSREVVPPTEFTTRKGKQRPTETIKKFF